VTCGVGDRYNTRSCTNPSAAHGGAPCSGSAQLHQTCDTGVSCAVHGNWGSWGHWAGCSVTCELGTWNRYRACDNPAPAHGGNPCAGSGSQTQQCDAGIMCPIDGMWGTWGQWGECSVTCEAIGVKDRTRVCDRPPAQYNGAYCVGSSHDQTSCDWRHRMCPSGNPWQPLYFSQPTVAPVNGGVGQWQAWEACTMTCGGGIKTRQRFCDNPAPAGSGSVCTESLIEVIQCNNVPCGTGTYVQSGSNGYSTGTIYINAAGVAAPPKAGSCDGLRGVFDCQNGIECIPIDLKCDCNPQCSDASDEDMTWAGCIMSAEECASGADDVSPVKVLLLASVASVLLFFHQLHH